MKPEIDKYLIEKALNGDTEAFGSVYFALRGSIYGFVFRMLGDVSPAEDITQETFMLLLENPKKFDSRRGEILSFLCGVARNKVMSFLRKSSTKNELLNDDSTFFDTFEASEINQLDILLKEELTEKIEEQIFKLPPLYREILILREIEELPYSEIAKITETELGQVKIRLYRARKMLAKELKPYLIGNKEKHYEMC